MAVMWKAFVGDLSREPRAGEICEEAGTAAVVIKGVIPERAAAAAADEEGSGL